MVAASALDSRYLNPELISQHTSPSPVRRSPFLQHTPPVSFPLSIHFFSTSPTVFDVLLHKYDFPPELASRVASELTHLKNPEKADSILSFFKESGFSNSQLVKIVKYRPRFLASSLEDSIKPKIKTFKDVGFSSDDIRKIISANPAILHLSVDNNIIPSLSVLEGLLGSNCNVARVVGLSPWFLTVNLKNTLVPNVEFLKSCDISMESIFIILNSFPSFFVFKPEIIRKSVDKAKEMGLNGSSKTFIYAIRAIASISNEAWERKLQAFRDFGFSESDIMTMFRKAPTSFCVSTEKIKKIKEILLATGKYNMSSIVTSPMSLLSSVENRYTPRLRILEILESRNLIKNWPTLSTLSTLSDDKFFEKFISPYLNEVSNDYVTKSFARGNKKMKP